MRKPRLSAAEGRVGVTRPSARLLPALLAAAMLLATAAPAQAAPPIPVLTGTNPPSPSTSLEPFVQGSSNGVITSAVPGAMASAFGSAAEPGARTIVLYESKTCAGPPIAEGSDQALDTAGIPISVEAETTTYVSAEQSDATGISGCSNAIEYQQVKELPPPPPGPPSNPGNPPGPGSPPDPPHLRTVPGGVANVDTPLVTGSAPGAVSVRIFTSPGCEGAPVASGSAAQLAAGITIPIVDNVVVAFYGVSVGPGGPVSRCSAPVYYVEDSTPPHTRITMGPAAKTRRHTAVFRFTDVNGEMPGTEFFCQVDRRSWSRCSSPLHLRRLRIRRYVVRVRAIDPAGNVEKKPALRRFKVL
jgi:hypothetical protein